MSDKFSVLADIVLLSMAVAAMSMTLTKAEVFKGTRDWIQKWTRKLWWFGWVLRKVSICPYCMSHWWAFLATAYYMPVVIASKFRFVDLSVSAFGMICLSAFWCGLIFKAFSQMSPKGEEDD